MLLGIFMASLLILAGCPQEDTGNGQVPPGAPGGVPPSGGGAAPQEEEPEETIPDEFMSWDMQALVALGQPVYCTVTYTDGSFTTESELFFKGESMRVESTSTMNGESYDAKMILVGNVSYLSMEGQTYGMDEDCDWVMMDFGRLQECIPEDMLDETGDTTEMFSADDYEAAPDDFYCEYGTFGDEKFVAQGKVCDMTEEMCEIYEMMGSGGYPQMPMDESMCAGLTGQDYQDCLDAVEAYNSDMQ